MGFGTAQDQLRTLIELVEHASRATRLEQACALAIETLARHPAKLPFASIHVCEPDARWRRVCGTSGTPSDAAQLFRLTEAVTADRPLVAENGSALIVPLRCSGERTPLGVLVVGLTVAHVVDEDALRFFAEVGHEIGCALTIASIQAQAERHLQVVALQDHALQTFFVIGLLARAALAELAPEQVSESVASALVQIIDVATTGREHLRQAIFALGHAEVGQTGLVDALQSLTRNFQERTGIDAEVLVRGIPQSLTTDMVETIHHAAAEALANIERHSRAGAVVLSLQFTRQSITLSVQDDGVGMGNPALERIASSATHFGLRGVGERVRRLGGTFVARPSREGGFLVRTRLPLTVRPS